MTGLLARVARLAEALAGGVSGRLVAAAPETPAAGEAVQRAASVQPEDRPPWDEEPLTPVEPKPAPRRTPAPAPAPRPEPQSGAKATDGSFWKGLVAGLRGKVGMAEYPFLSNPDMVIGVLEGEELTLWAENGMVKALLDKPAVTDLVAAGASARLGRPVRVRFREGKPPVTAAPASVQEPGEEPDALDALLAASAQFDNIIVTE